MTQKEGVVRVALSGNLRQAKRQLPASELAYGLDLSAEHAIPPGFWKSVKECGYG
jgi:hypothetical protein